MKGIIDLISTICPITGESVVDTIIFALISFASFRIAWELTGAFAIGDSETKSFIHWFIRLLIFVLLLSIALGVVNFIHWVGSWPWWGYLIFAISLFTAIGGIIALVIVNKKTKQNTRDLDYE